MKDRKMCKKNNDKSSKPSKGKKPTALVSSKPFRRARTKMKKLKFLSLSNTTQLQTVPSCEPTRTAMDNTSTEYVELFPVVQRDGIGNKEEPESMADQMFSEEGPGPTTLTGLLNGTISSTTTTTATSELSYYGATPTQDSVNSARSLVRTAMRRSREREEGSEEERWVSISDVHVVDRRSSEEEVTSSGGGGGGGSRLWLRLKLDYEQVLNTWSDSGKGPFFLRPYHLHHHQEDPPQTVPHLGFHQHALLPHWNVTNKEPWSVPEKSLNGQNRCHTQIGCSTGEEAWKMGLREASVLRYKEKRQSRLFRKRIRYEVRKLNAEKRPRIKGRFVKRCVD